MTNQYYIPKCFVKGLKEKTKHFETLKPLACSFNFLLREKIYKIRKHLVRLFDSTCTH